MHGLSSTTTKDGTIQVPLADFKPKCHFFFSQVSIQKGSSESFFGPTKGVPQNDFMFVPLPRFSQVQYSCKTLKMLTATNMDPQNKGFVFLSQKKVETNDAKAARRLT